nr:arabinogalactan endo-1,4-beta-galactosidase [Bacteroidales bacterium]
MKRILLPLLGLLLCGSLSAQKVTFPTGQLPFDNTYAFGNDLSFVLQNEKRGAEFYDTDGTRKSAWEIFRNHGYNWARLMICNEPSRLGQTLDYVVEGAKKLKENNTHFALDFMMSDGWSNPMTQPTPSSMREMTHKQRVDAFYDYVHHVITTLRDAGVQPEIVQVGNEISNGAFWPTGRVYFGPEKRDQSHWKEFTDYIKAGIKAIRDVDPRISVMLHVDFGGDLEMSDIFFAKMKQYKVNYDCIGFSFYPWSHGTLMDLRDNLYYTIEKYRKPVYVIETGYYSVPSQYFERKGVRGPFPET